MTAFIDIMYQLEYLGLSDVIIPFFLVFTVVFAVLQKARIFGKDQNANKRYNVIIAMVMSFAVVIPHLLGSYPPNMNAVMIINNALPQVSVFVIGIVMLLLMLGVFGIRWPGGDDRENGGSIVVIASILIIIYIFATSAGLLSGGQFPYWLWFLADPQTQTLLVTILVFGVVVWMITREEKEKKDKNDFVAFNPSKLKDEYN